MTRLLIYILVVLALAYGFAWLAERPGDLVLSWQGQRIETSLMFAVAVIVSLMALIMFSWWLIRSVLASPQMITRYFRARKRDRGYQALSTGLIAAGSGDAATARKMTQRTIGLLSADQEPLIHLLDAQTALIEGKNDEARAKFEAMAEDPETRELGLRGLYLEARRLGALEAAQHYAEQAAETAPHLPWAAEAALAFKSAEGAWDDALRILEKQRAARVIDKAAADRKKAVLLTARAIDKIEGGDVSGARTDGLEANRLAATLVPAALIAAQALFRENNLSKGSRILEKLWKSTPHPEVAETYIHARPGDSTHDRLKRAQKLEGLKRNHREALRAVARAALDAQEFKLAREKAEAASRMGPCESIYLLLADIEEADTGDQGRVRHWLAQAVRAPRDEAWTADGYVSDHWAAVSPVTGKLDVFEWKLPVEQISGPVHDADSMRDGAEQAIKSLPPIAVPIVAPAPAPEKPVKEPVDPVHKAPAPAAKEPAKPVEAPKAPKAPMPETAATKVPPAVESAGKSTQSQSDKASSPGKTEDKSKPSDGPEKMDSPQELGKVEKSDKAQPLDKAKPVDGDVIVAEKPSSAKPVVEGKKADDAPRPKDALDVEPAIRQAASVGETHIITDAVGNARDTAKKTDFLVKPIDDPGIDDVATEDGPKSRFRLF
tara:strand:- start:22910 stop:24901 length:1992 start_codon:yes stop_codon:yes gene_type:complete